MTTLTLSQNKKVAVLRLELISAIKNSNLITLVSNKLVSLSKKHKQDELGYDVITFNVDNYVVAQITLNRRGIEQVQGNVCKLVTMKTLNDLAIILK